MDEFEVYLVSNGSMQLYSNNTLASFTNHLSEPLSFDGNWRVALSSINIPTQIKNISTDWVLSVAPKDDKRDLKHLPHTLETGLYSKVSDVVDILSKTSGIPLTHTISSVNGRLTLTFPPKCRFVFKKNEKEVLNILGFEGYTNDSMYASIGDMSADDDDIEYKEFSTTGDYPADITAGKSLIFVYINIIEYQHVADTKAPLLRVLNHSARVKNGVVQHLDTQSSSNFKELEYKPLLSSNIQTIKVELRSEDGSLVPFMGTGRTTLTLKFKKLS